MNKQTLFMVLLGCTPKGRVTEQHDVFFGIAESLGELIPEMNAFWPEAKGKLHIDAWRKVTTVDHYAIEIESRDSPTTNEDQLFFLNLGGYKPGDFEEYHYKMLAVAPTLATAIKKAKQSVFYKHCGFEGAVSHIDDKYGIDVDEAYKVDDLLSAALKERFQIKIVPLQNGIEEDTIHIGYLKINTLRK